MAPTPSSLLLEKILSKNAELTHTLTSLSQEKTALKHKVTSLERQLYRAESENIPISEMAPSKVSVAWLAIPTEFSLALVLSFKYQFVMFSFPGAAFIRALPACRELPESSGVPETLPAPAARRIQGVRAGHPVPDRHHGRATVATASVPEAPRKISVSGTSGHCHLEVRIERVVVR